MSALAACVALVCGSSWSSMVCAQKQDGVADERHNLAKEANDFVDWAKTSAMPVSGTGAENSAVNWDAVDRIVGKAKIVGLSEALHGGAEPLQFRNQVFEYLVKKKGFTVIALESGLVESRVVHDYVAGGPGELTTVMMEGFGVGFGQLPQNRELVRWMRAYNQDPRHFRKVAFYGFDVPGSMGYDNPRRGPGTGLIEALKYLKRVDAGAEASIRARVGPLLPKLHLILAQPAGPADYRKLSQAERDTLTAAIADLIDQFERRPSLYINRSTSVDYEWAYQAALGARHTDQWLRKVPGETAKPLQVEKWFGAATDVRDRAQAENIAWLLNREGADSRILVFMHRYHLSSTPVDASWWSGQGNEVTGTYLRKRFGNELVTIGGLMGEAELNCRPGDCCASPLYKVPRAESSIDGMLSRLHLPRFLLDVRAAPSSIREWLNHGQQLGHGQDVLKLPVATAYDAIYYVDSVTPACNADGGCCPRLEASHENERND